MLKENGNIFIKAIMFIIIVIDALVPLILCPYWDDKYYLPKIIAIYILLILAIIITFISYKAGEYKIVFFRELTPLLLFQGVVILSTLFSPYFKQAIFGANLRWEGAFTYISYFLILYFTLICCTKFENINTIVRYLMISSSIISLYALLQYFNIDPLPRDAIRMRWNYVSFSTLGNPNFLGSYLSMLFPMSICLYIWEKQKKIYRLLFLLCTLLYSALICSRARSAWLGVFISLLILAIVFRGTIKKNLRKILILLAAFIIVTLLLNGAHDNLIGRRLKSFVDDYKRITDESRRLHAGSQRIFIWSRTMERIMDRPFLGTGPDTFDKIFDITPEEAEKYFGNPNIYVDKAHNEYLQIAATMGFPAMIFYMCFFIIIFYKTVSIIKNKKYDTLTVCFFSAIIAYWVQAFFNISVVSVAPLHWSVLGMLIGNIHLHENKRN